MKNKLNNWSNKYHSKQKLMKNHKNKKNKRKMMNSNLMKKLTKRKMKTKNQTKNKMMKYFTPKTPKNKLKFQHNLTKKHKPNIILHQYSHSYSTVLSL